MRFVLLALFCVLALASVAGAGPFIVCDSYTAPAVVPDYFKVSLDGAPEVQTPLWSGTPTDGIPRVNSIHYDVGGVAVGLHQTTVKACKAATLWDVEKCTSVPFEFPRPDATVAPNALTGTKLTN